MPYIDTSIEQGVREFRAEDGHDYRFERDITGPYWKMYWLEGRAYVFIRTIKAARNAGCWSLARHI